MSGAASLPPGAKPKPLTIGEFQAMFGTMSAELNGTKSEQPSSGASQTEPEPAIELDSPFMAKIAREKRPPRKTLTIPVKGWVEGWPNAPKHPIVVGLRIPSEEALTLARAEAARRAWALHDNPNDDEGRVECYNGAVMVGALAVALCKPDNALEPRWTGINEIISNGMTSDTIQWLFDELNIYMGATSPTSLEATDEEMELVAEGIITGQIWKGINGAAAHRIKRLMRCVLDEAQRGAPVEVDVDAA